MLNQYQRRAEPHSQSGRDGQGLCTSHEKEVLEGVVEDTRQGNAGDGVTPETLTDPDSLQGLPGHARPGLTSALSRLLAVVEELSRPQGQPELLALQAQLEEHRKPHRGGARAIPIEAVRVYNTSLRTFPRSSGTSSGSATSPSRTSPSPTTPCNRRRSISARQQQGG